MASALISSALRASGATASPLLHSVTAPLVTSTADGHTSWAVVDMGRNDGNNALFPQLFRYSTTTPHWVLATPQGVADNGGIFIGAGASGSLLAGIGTSQSLAFSPLAFTIDSGRSWTPGGLQAGLARVPSAIALGPSDSAAVLISNNGSRTALKRSGSLEQWSTLVSTKSLSTLTPSCGLTALDAVDITADGHYLIGSTCDKPGTIGVFGYLGGHWVSEVARIPTALSNAAFETIRLDSSGTVTDALFAARSANARKLVAGWSQGANATWTLSPSVELDANSQIVATGSGPGEAEFVLIRSGAKLHALFTFGPASSWQDVTTLPANTQSVALEPDGALDAFVVHISTLTIWHRARAGSAFTKSQTINVPIQYGSSS